MSSCRSNKRMCVSREWTVLKCFWWHEAKLSLIQIQDFGFLNTQQLVRLSSWYTESTSVLFHTIQSTRLLLLVWKTNSSDVEKMDDGRRRIRSQWAHADFVKCNFTVRLCWICRSSIHDSHRDTDEGAKTRLHYRLQYQYTKLPHLLCRASSNELSNTPLHSLNDSCNWFKVSLLIANTTKEIIGKKGWI